MTRINNTGTTSETPLTELQHSLRALKYGEKVSCANSREEILKAQENLTRRRHEIPGADSHLEYIEALLLAESSGQLQFRS